MSKHTARRKFLATTLDGATTAALAALGMRIPRAFAATVLTGVEWGGAYIDSMRKLVAQQDAYNVHWVLHTGGAASVLPKIKTSWPTPPYDFVAAWNPVFQTMLREDWMQPFSVEEDVPNLKDVPGSLIMRNSDGKAVTIPRSLTGGYWYYREDTCPIEVNEIGDLLSPKLKGQIVFPLPTLTSNMAMVTLALSRGGDEKNLESAWDFVRELAKSGNIGRVATADIEVTNSISSTETSVAFGAAGIPRQLSSAGLPIHHLSKMPADSGFKSVVWTEGWTVLKGGKTEHAFDFLNFCMSPKMNTLLNAVQKQSPTNTKSTPPQGLEHFTFTDAELKESTYTPDWGYVSRQINHWAKRWEQEIAPLL